MFSASDYVLQRQLLQHACLCPSGLTSHAHSLACGQLGSPAIGLGHGRRSISAARYACKV